jgi:hypothetical protein
MEGVFNRKASAAIILCTLVWILLSKYRTSPFPESQTYDWSSKLEGWHGRAHPHSSPSYIDLTKVKMVMASRYSAEYADGFNMALFELDTKGMIAVNASGQVLVLEADDATAFNTLLGSTLSLPKQEYRIWYFATCQPFHFVNVADEGGQLKEFSIYAYSRSMRDLEDNAGQLPEALWELFGVVEEAGFRDEDFQPVGEVLKIRLKHLG